MRMDMGGVSAERGRCLSGCANLGFPRSSFAYVLSLAA